MPASLLARNARGRAAPTIALPGPSARVTARSSDRHEVLDLLDRAATERLDPPADRGVVLAQFGADLFLSFSLLGSSS
jgi:hypothetical protein